MKLARCRTVRAIGVAAVLVFAWVGPAESKTQPDRDPSPSAAPGSTAAVAAAVTVPPEAGPSSQGATVSQQSFAVAVTVPAKVASGARATVRVSVRPKPGWKLNEEFPTKLTVTAPSGVTVEKDKLRKGDARQFSPKGGEFDVAFTASSAGDKKFDATFKFAVCTDSSCDPKKIALQWVVSVE